VLLEEPVLADAEPDAAGRAAAPAADGFAWWLCAGLGSGCGFGVLAHELAEPVDLPFPLGLLAGQAAGAGAGGAFLLAAERGGQLRAAAVAYDGQEVRGGVGDAGVGLQLGRERPGLGLGQVEPEGDQVRVAGGSGWW
jgi:hypothetical protein